MILSELAKAALRYLAPEGRARAAGSGLALAATIFGPSTYTPCARLQARVVHRDDRVGDRIDYRAVAADPDGPACRALFRVDPTALTAASKEAQIAFWVNAYNFLTVFVIAEAGDRFSVRQDGQAIFSHQRVEVAGQRLTFDEIEHGKLRQLTDDPRIPLLLHCGTRDCAPLPTLPLTDTRQEAQIEAALTRFLSLPGTLSIDERAGVVVMSHLFHPEWDGHGIVARYGSLVAFAARYRPELRGLAPGRLTLAFRPYDWRLDAWRPHAVLP
jgi:hypothetical protein